MKKLVFTVAFVTMILNVQAQKEKIKFGLKAGVNLANATGNGVSPIILDDSGEKGNSKTGLLIGGFLNYEISNKFYLQPEVLFSQQGLKKSLYDNEYEIKLKLGYINIPIMAKYYTTDNLYIEIGPQLGFLSSANHYEKDNDFNETIETDVKGFFKKTDFGLNFGAGYQLKNGLGFNARYTLGLSNILDFSYIIEINKPDSAKVVKADENNGFNFEIKNRVLNFSLFYTF